MTPTQGSLHLQLHQLMDDLDFRIHNCVGPDKPLGGVCLHPNTPGGQDAEEIVERVDHVQDQPGQVPLRQPAAQSWGNRNEWSRPPPKKLSAMAACSGGAARPP
jgi:hypothetical protein